MLLEQIIKPDGTITTKLDMSIQRLKSFEPPEGYFVAFSGGKDSQCIYHLCKMAGVKFDAHYTVTSVDPPELIYFIREHYPDVKWNVPHDKDGKRISMWNLILEHCMPPTRVMRYCCADLKESSGKGRIVVTGVRWAESARRLDLHGVAVIHGKPKTTQALAKSENVNYRLPNKTNPSLIMNDDNAPERRMVERCYRTQKTMVNPIVDWTDKEVWEFLNNIAKVPHCNLYDEGYMRIGCIGCPLAGKGNQMREFERYPRYRALYIRAFDRMLQERKRKGLETTWQNGEEVMDWWIDEKKYRREKMEENE